MGAARARELARGFLQHDPDRWLHVQEVAARAEELRPAVAAADGPVLVVAAWLHDIGYSPALRVTSFHPLDGARYLHRAGYPREAALVAHHSGARFVAEVRGLTTELAAFPFAEDPLTDALTYADQTVGPRGQRLPVADGSPRRSAGTAPARPPRSRRRGGARTSTPPPNAPKPGSDCRACARSRGQLRAGSVSGGGWSPARPGPPGSRPRG